MKWISIDPGKAKSGVAVWQGPDLVDVLRVSPRGDSGECAHWRDGKVATIYKSMFEAWLPLVSGAQVVVCEAGFVDPRKRQAAMVLEHTRGQLDMVAQAVGVLTQAPVTMHWSNIGAWREAVLKQYGPKYGVVIWPKEDKHHNGKKLAAAWVRDLFGRDVSWDEAEAVLIGDAWKLAGGLVTQGM